jgi:membrane associated rhomboid family serine protease
MGIADRDHYRQAPNPGDSMFAQLTPVVKWLLGLNLGIYFLDTLLKGDAENGPLRAFGAFTVESAIHGGRIWEFITFQFLHGSLGHVFFNCVGIFFFGPWMERWWGSKKFLIFYLICGAAGAAFYTLLSVFHVFPEVWIPASQFNPSDLVGLDVRNGLVHLPQSLVGASAGIYGIFIGVALVAPDLRVSLLFPPIELSMRQLALALLAIAVGTIVLQFGNEGGQAGHLGGAILGYFLVRYPQLLGRSGDDKIVRPKEFARRPPEAKLRPRSQMQIDQASAVDAILDKISREGLQSLTKEEREFLQKASEKP